MLIFRGETFNVNVIRADGLKIPDLLSGILPLVPPDTYVDFSLIMMDVVPGDTLDPKIKEAYLKQINKHWAEKPEIEDIERFAFYERTRSAFAVVMTGDTAKYGNIILKKGLVLS